MELWAPNRVTESAAAPWAKRTAASKSAPASSAARKAPLKVSPAAVVSTALTRKPGMSACFCPVAAIDPLRPQGDHHLTDAHLVEAGGSLPGARFVRHLDAGQQLGLGLVGVMRSTSASRSLESGRAGRG